MLSIFSCVFVPSLERCLFWSSEHFLIGILYWVVWAVCIYWKLSLLVTSLHILCLPVAFSFCLWFPLLCKILRLIRSIRFIFAFIFIALRDRPKKALVRQLSENVLPLLCPRSFMVSCLIFKPLSHPEFVYGVRVCSNFVDLHAATQLS